MDKASAESSDTALRAVLDRHSVRTTEVLVQAVRVAMAAQKQRYDKGESNQASVTRSTALWAAMTVDTDIRSVLETAGIDYKAWSKKLRLSTTHGDGKWASLIDSGIGMSDVYLHDELTAALDVYFRTPPGHRFGTVELAEAILLSADHPDVGLLPQRLKDVGYDQVAALEGLRSLRPSDSEFQPSLDVLADVPVDDLELDVMNFRPYVEAIVELIQNGNTRTPLSIAINGAWGSGKTSLGKMVHGQLEKETPRPVVVWFNAWLHDGAEDLGAALTAKIGAELASHRSAVQRFLRPTRTEMLSPRQRFVRKLWVGALAAVFVAAFAWFSGLLGLVEGLTSENDSVEALDVVTSGGALSILFTAIANWSRFVGPARAAAAFVASPREEAQEGTLDQAKSELAGLIRQVHDHHHGNIVVFVDDLERCHPPKGVEICEIVAQLLDHEHVVLIYLADMRRLAAMVDIKYDRYARLHRSGRQTPKRSDGEWGRHYMQKMVQIQIDVPELPQKSARVLFDAVRTQQAPQSVPTVRRSRSPRAALVRRSVQLVRDVRSTWIQRRRLKRYNSSVDERSGNGGLDTDQLRQIANAVGFDEETAEKLTSRHPSATVTEAHLLAERFVLQFAPNNPRALKQLSNRLRLEIFIAVGKGLFDREDQKVVAQLIGKWTILCNSWPTLATDLRTSKVMLRELEEVSQNNSDELGNVVLNSGVDLDDLEKLSTILKASPAFGRLAEAIAHHHIDQPVESSQERNG